jgi:ComF family protein
VIRRLADALLSALLAPQCVVCKDILETPLAGAVCERCWRAVAAQARARASVQRAVPAAVARASAIGEYEGTLREIVHALKYDGRRSIAPRLSALMALHGVDVLAGADAIVPVPLHPRRERMRGFNQADDLARGLGLPVVRLLRRVKSTQPQVDLPAAERHRNVRDAFAMARPRLWSPQASVTDLIVVLVDDVATTGATLEMCACVLKEAGVAEVRALTAARVASEPRPGRPR